MQKHAFRRLIFLSEIHLSIIAPLILQLKASEWIFGIVRMNMERHMDKNSQLTPFLDLLPVPTKKALRKLGFVF